MRVFIYYPRNKTYDRSAIRHSLFKAPPPPSVTKKLLSLLFQNCLRDLQEETSFSACTRGSWKPNFHDKTRAYQQKQRYTLDNGNQSLYIRKNTHTHARHCLRRDARVSHYTSARAAIHSRCSGLGTITSRGKNLLAPAINPRCRNTADTTRCCCSSAVEFVKRRGVTRQVAKKRRYCCCFTCVCVCMYMYAR